MAPPIDLLFAVDPEYAAPLGVALASIAATSSSPLRAHVLHDGLSEARRARVQACAPMIELHWREIADPALLNLAQRRHFSRAAAFRLAAPELLPELDRVLYLDADILVLVGLSPLWTLDLQGRALAAVDEALVDPQRFAAAHQKRGWAQGVFNSGVLLMDLRLMRSQGAAARMLELVEHRFEQLRLPDQDALNLVFWNAWTRLSPEWNAQRVMIAEPERLPRDPVIIHFNQGLKPWHADDTHPFALQWWETLSRTPFAREVAEAGRLTQDVFEARRARYAAWRQLQADRQTAAAKATP